LPAVNLMDQIKLSKKLPFSSVIAVVLLLVIVFWFVTGQMYSFYASMVFTFYSLTHSMWISVILLGVLQTFLMIPFRIIRLLDFKNIRDFQSEIMEKGDSSQQESSLKQEFKKGNWTLTLYLLDFAVAITSYVTIGRLFLTDFYTKHLNPAALFSFVKYPEYPIADRFFKIPYPSVTKTLDLGFESVLYAWLLIIIIELTVSIFKSLRKPKDGISKSSSRLSSKYLLTYGVILMALSYGLIRHFPVDLRLNIFTGDVARQNTTFNTVTAVATFLTLMWFGANDIIRKGRIAAGMGISQRTIDKVQKRLFSDTVFRASLIGLGAFFITNQIPCAFELSIFTLELISLFSPLTLDKWILKSAPKKDDLEEDKKQHEVHEVNSQFSVKMEG
jgi:hypothetical protein